MRRSELIIFPMPGISHLIPMVEMAKLIARRDDRFSISFLIVSHPPDKQVNSYLDSLDRSSDIFVNNRITFLELPELEKPLERSSRRFIENVVEGYSPIIKQIIKEKVSGTDRPACGIIVDMFCTGIIDVANDLNVPAYVLYTSSASSLALLLHFQDLQHKKGVDVTELGGPDTELDIPGFEKPVPGWAVPTVLLDKSVDGGSVGILNQVKRYREAKGIIVNTFTAVESSVIPALSQDPDVPTVYDVGPIVNLNPTSGGDERDWIVAWLDEQPPSSVVFLCFGSIGGFAVDQVKEIAYGLEKSGKRFLWSLRGHDNLDDLLPVGFVDRTAGIGKIIGWAPQIDVLAHRAIGGFVSHCGWNSVMESLWFGVPLGTWPLYAEQQLNAFRLVLELGLAVEIKMDYRWDMRTRTSGVLVNADEIGNGIKKLMDLENEGLRSKVNKMSEEIRKAAGKGGSCYASVDRFIEDVFKNDT
ncbi:hypothetical protein Droror1_Dr00009085 [Drosera rotundifolia]